MKIYPKDRKALVDAALGKRICDLVIKNANMVNVFTGEIYGADIGIYDGFIAHVQCDPDGLNREEDKLEGKEYYDAKGAYIIPGLVDCHIHIESTLMTPRYFTEAAVIHGTTTIMTDPHEIANVYGVDGIKYMHECSEGLPMRHYILAASCVPSVPGKENGGATFGPKEIEELLELDRVIGLGEVMDYPGVIHNDPRMVDIIGIVDKKDMFIQGHAFCIYGRELSAYACGGPMSDHESICAQDARDRLRIGINVNARESSISQDVQEIVSNIMDFKCLHNITWATDDTESDDILKRGHENYIVKRAIKAGMDPIDAIRTATINGAMEIGVKNIGAIAPGYVADLIITDSLEEIDPKAVFFEGRLVAEDQQLVIDIEDKKFEIEEKNSLKIGPITLEDFKIKAPIKSGKIKCNIIKCDPVKAFMTDFAVEELPVKDGYIDISHDSDLKYVIVINRYGNGTIGKAVVRGYGTNTGAIGSTVAHDCHNLIMIYDTPENANVLLQDLIEMKGGFSSVKDGKVLEHVALPVGGIMANQPIHVMAEKSKKFKESMRSLGLKNIEFPLFVMSILSLPVVPVARVTDMGIVNAITQQFVDMFDAE